MQIQEEIEIQSLSPSISNGRCCHSMKFCVSDEKSHDASHSLTAASIERFFSATEILLHF